MVITTENEDRNNEVRQSKCHIILCLNE